MKKLEIDWEYKAPIDRRKSARVNSNELDVLFRSEVSEVKVFTGSCIGRGKIIDISATGIKIKICPFQYKNASVKISFQLGQYTFFLTGNVLSYLNNELIIVFSNGNSNSKILILDSLKTAKVLNYSL